MWFGILNFITSNKQIKSFINRLVFPNTHAVKFAEKYVSQFLVFYAALNTTAENWVNQKLTLNIEKNKNVMAQLTF